MKLLPYYIKDGIPSMRDSDIMGLYDRMVDEGTAEIVFPDGAVNNREDFVFLMKQSNLVTVMKDDKLLGFVYFTHRMKKTARMHFCPFLEARPGLVKVGRFILEGMITIFDVIEGRIPYWNTGAIDFVKRLGFVEVGTIPMGLWNENKKQSEDCILLYYKG